MKKIGIKMIAGCILLVFFAINSFGQTTTKTTKDGGKRVAKVEKTKVPKAVTDVWIGEYPGSTYDNWYGYPAYNDYLSNWYYDWDNYDYNPYVYTDYPEDYVVEYNLNSVPYKSVYSKEGKKIATHKTLTSDLPKAVTAAISNSAYKTWKLGKEKEEIFKDKDTDKLKVYKVVLTKGNEKHTLYFQADGQLLKDKKVA